MGLGLTCGGGSARGECHLLVHELGARPGLMLEQRHARAPLLALDLVRVRVRAWVRVRAGAWVRVRAGAWARVRRGGRRASAGDAMAAYCEGSME